MRSPIRLLIGAVCCALFASVVGAQPIFRERHSNPAGVTLRGFAASETMLVAVGDAGRVLASADGLAWTGTVSGVTETLRAVTHDGAQFVAVGDRGRILLSSDGRAWRVAASSGTDARLNAVLRTGARLVAVGENGTIVTSADAETWTRVASGTTRALRGIGYFRTSPTLVAVGEAGIVLTSPDGTTWTPRDSGTMDNLEAIDPVGAPYVGENGAVFFSGFTITGAGAFWNARSARGTATGHWRGVASASPNAFRIAVGDGGRVAGSAGNFRDLESGTPRDLKAVGFARNTFFAVGEAETILQGAPYEATISQRLTNLSVRSPLAATGPGLIGGFVISGTGTKRLLVRAAGPALVALGVDAAVADPTLTIVDANGQVVARNTGWRTAANADASRAMAASIGAFAFAETSRDSALLLELAPGAYTAHIAASSDGVALLEVWDPETWPIYATSRLANLSTLCTIDSAEGSTIVGFGGAQGRRLLLRAIGPTLETFGVRGVLADPQIEVIRPAVAGGTRGSPVLFPPTTVARNDNWNTYLSPFANGLGASQPPDVVQRVAAACGAFPLPEASKDAAVVVTAGWPPFTLHVSGADGGYGVALIEVYDVSDL